MQAAGTGAVIWLKFNNSTVDFRYKNVQYKNNVRYRNNLAADPNFKQ